MLVPNLKSDMSQQVRNLDYTFTHYVLCILAPITNDGFPFHDIMSGHLLLQAWVCLINTSVKARLRNNLLRTVY